MADSTPEVASTSITVAADDWHAALERLAALEDAKVEAEAEADRVRFIAAHEGLTAAFVNINDHIKARAAQHPEHAEHFAKALELSAVLVKRLEPDEGSVIRPPSESEARMLHTYVHKLVRGRDHLELSYLAELVDDALTASLSVPA